MFLVTAHINFESYPETTLLIYTCATVQLRNASRARQELLVMKLFAITVVQNRKMIEEETDVYYPVCCACSGRETVKKYGK